MSWKLVHFLCFHCEVCRHQHPMSRDTHLPGPGVSLRPRGGADAKPAAGDRGLGSGQVPVAWGPSAWPASEDWSRLRNRVRGDRQSLQEVSSGSGPVPARLLSSVIYFPSDSVRPGFAAATLLARSLAS